MTVWSGHLVAFPLRARPSTGSWTTGESRLFAISVHYRCLHELMMLCFFHFRSSDSKTPSSDSYMQNKPLIPRCGVRKIACGFAALRVLLLALHAKHGIRSATTPPCKDKRGSAHQNTGIRGTLRISFPSFGPIPRDLLASSRPP